MFLTPKIKEKIIGSLPYRLYLRILMRKKEIRYSVEITTKCNVNCVMCTRAEMIKKHKLNIGEINKNIWKKILLDMKKFVNDDYKVVFAPMGLGEPLMNNKLNDILLDVKKTSNKIYIILVTNGVMLNDKYSRDLIDIGVDEISISLNVNNPKDYLKYIRGADNYMKIRDNIKNLIRIRNRKRFSKTKVFIQYLDYKGNINKFSDDIKKWSKLMRSGDKCYVHPIVNQAGFKKDGITIRNRKNFPCFSPLSRVAIRINGDMYPCDPCFYGGNTKIKELFLGNIKSNSFYNLIKNKKSKIYEIIDKMKKDQYDLLPTCSQCNTYKIGGNIFFNFPFGIKVRGRKWF